jgi:hypothetical protein
MQCRFRVYGNGRLLAEHVGEVVDRTDTQTISRIEQGALMKGRVEAGPAPVRDFRVEGPEFSSDGDKEKPRR